MRRIPLEVLGEVDNINRLEWTFLHAYTAPDAQRLTEVGYLTLRPDLDTQLTKFNDRTRLLTLLSALLRLAPFSADDGNTREGVARRIGLLRCLLLRRHSFITCLLLVCGVRCGEGGGPFFSGKKK